MTQQSTQAYSLALEINAMLRVCILATDGDLTIAEWQGESGLGRTLEVIERKTDALLELVEQLEMKAAKAQAA